jgi:hypothetical protein
MIALPFLLAYSPARPAKPCNAQADRGGADAMSAVWKAIESSPIARLQPHGDGIVLGAHGITKRFGPVIGNRPTNIVSATLSSAISSGSCGTR